MNSLYSHNRHEAPVDFETDNVIDLDELDLDEREQVIEFLVSNEIKFHKDSDGMFAANVRIVEPQVLGDLVGDHEERKRDDHDIHGMPITMDGKVYRRASRPPEEMQRVIGAMKHKDTLFDYSCYPRLSSLVTLKEHLKPRRRTLAWVMRTIQDVYDARFAMEHTSHQHEAADEQLRRLSSYFPVFLVDFLSKQYGLRKLVDQTCWDIMYNVHAMRKDYIDVEMFARFVEEYYDQEELMFYLYARDVVQREMKLNFRHQWIEHGVASPGQTPVSGTRFKQTFLAFREVKVITKLIFGSEAKGFCKSFVSEITAKMTINHRKKSISVVDYLHAALDKYHGIKPSADTAGNTTNDTDTVSEPHSSTTQSSVDQEYAAAERLRVEQYIETMERDRIAILEMEKQLQEEDSALTPLDVADEEAIQPAPLSTPPPPPPVESPRQLPPQPEVRPLDAKRAPALQLAEVASPPSSPGFYLGKPTHGDTPTDQVFKELRHSMQRNERRYLDVLLSSADALTPAILKEIEAEVEVQLSQKVESVLSAVTGAPLSPKKMQHVHTNNCESVPGSCSLIELEKSFRDILLDCHHNGVMSEVIRRKVDSLCRRVLQTPEVRQEIEPLVALLVTYASARVGGE